MLPKSRQRDRGVVKIHVSAALSTGNIRLSLNRRPGHYIALSNPLPGHYTD